MFGKDPEPLEVVKVVAGTIDLSGPVVIDLEEIRDEPVNEGWHVVEIERCEPKLSRQKHLPQLFVLSRVVDEADVEYNRMILWNLMLEGAGMVFTKRCFKALDMPSVLDYPTYQDLANELIGRQVEVKVKHKTNKGEIQANVNNWRPATSDIAF